MKRKGIPWKDSVFIWVLRTSKWGRAGTRLNGTVLEQKHGPTKGDTSN